MFRFIKKDYFIIVLFYSIAYFFILTNGGLFWDDWARSNIGDKQRFITMFAEYGWQWFGHFCLFFLSLKKGIFLIRLITFLSYLFSAVFVYKILKGIKEIDNLSRLIITLFFSLFPVNFARIAFINTFYALCNFLFFTGFFLIYKYLKCKKIHLRILSLPLFFISYYTNSLLVFYSLVILYILYSEKEQIGSFNKLSLLFLKYADFFVLPFVYWGYKIIFLKPFGLYEGYNVVRLKGLLLAPAKIPFTLQNSFIVPLNQISALFFDKITKFVFWGFVIFKSLRSNSPNDENDKNIRYLTLLGLTTFIIGAFPYLAIGRVLDLWDWGSRHQILIPLGAGILLYYSLKILMNELNVNHRVQCYLYSLIIALFISTNYSSYLDYQKDWFKQLSIMEHFKESDIIRDNSTFLFTDKTTGLNARRRGYRSYEFTGMMNYIFEGEKRFGTNDVTDFRNIERLKENIPYAEYSMRNYKIQPPQYEIIIDYGTIDLGKNNMVIKLILLKMFAPSRFTSEIKKIVRLEYVKL